MSGAVTAPPETLPELLDAAARSSGRVWFSGDAGSPVSMTELWRRSERAAAFFRGRVEPGEAAALMLDASPDCLVSLLGAWRAGIAVASLPQRARGMRTDEYTEGVRRWCELVHAGVLAVPDHEMGSFQPLAQRVVPFSLCAGFGARRDATEAGDFIQFSSGSGGSPKGVRLTSSAIAANIKAILAGFGDPAREMVCCSWLPLSHDMGLIGACLTTLAGMGLPCRARELVLMPPAAFLARPESWLRACSERAATTTWAPNFALDMTARTLAAGRGGMLDLSALRIAIVAAEPVRADSLRRFAAATEAAGLDPLALCPAYGLAEAAVGVTCVPPGRSWTSVKVSAEDLGRGRWTPAAGSDGMELVSCGPPLPGMRIRTEGNPGPLSVGGPSLLSEYVGLPGCPPKGGWLTTSDLAAVREGELYVIGRLDDVIVVAGRKLHPGELEATASECTAVRPGNCVAVPDGAGRYVVIAEVRLGSGPAPSGLREACGWIRRRLVERHGAGPSAVEFVAPGTLPKTSSGKLQRSRLSALYGSRRLDVRATARFGSRR
ncbi:AMP-binding protein [Actinomadura rubrisoli]|uniref:AMP-dependent synthetase/ligase domain-containing protein n=1 Tax=Actinomadura rubrisoli TaxID=2530368 RepID=A0A4R5BUD4_9ACTN|nr:AMP-binding protein [Actinomadura rubrisoli]TDD87832.1 hypothetical protein E1298_15660 [Actinomadura rubrisoli]